MSWVDRIACLVLDFHSYRIEITPLLDQPAEWVCVHCGRRKPLHRDTTGR